MNQNQMIDKIQELAIMRNEHLKHAKSISNEIFHLKKSCNHHYKDGALAIKDLYDAADQRNERECIICGACWNAYGVRI